MADLPVAGAACKTVQQLVDDGDEVPGGYIWRDGGNIPFPIDLTVPLAEDLPVIDMDALQLSSDAAAAELLKLRSSLASWGCFQLINHGIETSLLEEVRKLSREFFHMPMAEKQKYSRSENDYEGYGNDIILFENQSLDWNDRLYLIVRPEEEQKPKYWPEKPEYFRKILNDYTDKLREVYQGLLKAMSRSLSLSDDSFLKHCGERPTMYARFNYYPCCAWPDQVLGLKPHADGSGMTILLQDEYLEGLQVLKGNQWFCVPTLPHALLVNVGDQIEIMSNGVFKSPVHRALTNSERERHTLAMFCSPDVTQEIEPITELVDASRPRSFKKVKNYPETYFHYIQQGMRPIDALRI